MLLRVTMVTLAMACTLGAAPVLAADDGEMNAKSCIIDKDLNFHDDNGKYTFRMDFENDCARSITCTVDAYITGARGPSSGHAILLFAAKTQAPTPKSYTMKVKAAGGTAQVARSCTFL
ncbi:hypothetical protein V1282_000339 [Nitrobacteraceae bacterium AZCC 2146]